MFPWGVCTGFCSVPAVTIRLRWMLGLQKPCMDADRDACPAARKRRFDFQLGERVLIGCGFIMIVNGLSIGKGAYLYPNRCVDQIGAATTVWALACAMAVRALGRAHAGGDKRGEYFAMCIGYWSHQRTHPANVGALCSTLTGRT